MGTRSVPASTDSVAPLVTRGWALMRERQWQRARDVFGEAASRDEHAGVAWEGVAGASMCLDDFDGARAAMERAFR
ncbi:MAG TPA: hypothetical protein VG871_23320, partial [Vicinamibacterales bacterium]|nr:hypothetical protein [Vicinamibacterales bacterium]